MPNFTPISRAAAVSVGVACLASMTSGASAADLVPVTIRVCAPTAMTFYDPGSSGSPDGFKYTLSSPTYQVSGSLNDSKNPSNTTAVRGADGCWSKSYKMPEGPMDARFFSLSPKLAVDACWPVTMVVSSTVSISAGTVVELRLPEPTLIPVQVRSPEGKLVVGATFASHHDINDPAGLYRFDLPGTAALTVGGLSTRVGMTTDENWRSHDYSGCSSGSNLAAFDPAPDARIGGVVRFTMPDGGQQVHKFTESLADGLLSATLPYSVPETSLSLPGQTMAASSVAAGSPVSRLSVKGSGAAVVNAVLKDEATGAPVPNVPVVAEFYDRARFRWIAAAQGRTSRSGVASVRINAPRSTTYRIRPAWVGAPAHLVVSVSPTAPSKVQKVAAKAGSRRAVLKWRAPADSGGSPLTGYRVQWKKAGAKKWASKSLPAKKLALTKGKLVPGTKYQFRVQAINKAGRSAWVKKTVTPKP